jgi:hypothetical protein
MRRCVTPLLAATAVAVALSLPSAAQSGFGRVISQIVAGSGLTGGGTGPKVTISVAPGGIKGEMLDPALRDSLRGAPGPQGPAEVVCRCGLRCHTAGPEVLPAGDGQSIIRLAGQYGTRRKRRHFSVWRRSRRCLSYGSVDPWARFDHQGVGGINGRPCACRARSARELAGHPCARFH